MTPPPLTPGRPTQLRIALSLRRRLARRQAYDRLDDAGRRAWRVQRLAELRRHAVSRSSLYRRSLAGLEGAPLGELPTIDKTDLVERFDELVAVDVLRRDDLLAVLQAGPGDRRTGRGAADRYRLATSSGSSGSPAVLAFDEGEWIDLIANAARARAVSGRPQASDGGPVRSAKVGSPSPWHLSAQLPATLQDPRKPSLSLSAADPIGSIVAALEEWAPTILGSYPSMLRELMGEQVAGSLRIAPAQVFSSGEHLSAPTRELVREVWATEVFDQYVATEVGFVATECPAHQGMHVLDDHVVVEVVDDDGRPCPAGEEGHVIVTPLHARTVPLIRYRIGDRATLTDGPCPCGRPGQRLASVAGADRDVLRFRSATGSTVPVHPVAITALVDRLPVGRWRVSHGPDLLALEVTSPGDGFDAVAATAQLSGALVHAGAHPEVEVRVQVVERIELGAGGKAGRFRPIPPDAPTR